MRIALLIAFFVFLTAACARESHGESAAAPTASAAETPRTVDTHGFHCDGFEQSKPGWSCYQFVGKYGVRCSGYVAPGQTPNPLPAPPSYPVRDIGRPGVPRLDATDIKTIAAIARRRHSPTLRFVILRTGGGAASPGLVVFDAVSGPCDDYAPGYAVLNTRSDDLFYEPGDDPYFVHAGST